MQAFGAELEPIVEQLNALIKKYKIFPIDDVIILKDYKNRITPFIGYERFPEPSSSIAQSIDL
jgi:hypothetical protein